MKADQAKLEHVTVLRTRNGLKANLDEVREFAYPTAYHDQYVTQDVGFGEEMKPSFVGTSSLFDHRYHEMPITELRGEPSR